MAEKGSIKASTASVVDRLNKKRLYYIFSIFQGYFKKINIHVNIRVLTEIETI